MLVLYSVRFTTVVSCMHAQCVGGEEGNELGCEAVTTLIGLLRSPGQYRGGLLEDGVEPEHTPDRHADQPGGEGQSKEKQPCRIFSACYTSTHPLPTYSQASFSTAV